MYAGEGIYAGEGRRMRRYRGRGEGIYAGGPYRTCKPDAFMPYYSNALGHNVMRCSKYDIHPRIKEKGLTEEELAFLHGDGYYVRHGTAKNAAAAARNPWLHYLAEYRASTGSNDLRAAKAGYPAWKRAHRV